jgi:hypothetical protein
MGGLLMLRPGRFTAGKDTRYLLRGGGGGAEPARTDAENLAPTGIGFPDSPAVDINGNRKCVGDCNSWAPDVNIGVWKMSVAVPSASLFRETFSWHWFWFFVNCNAGMLNRTQDCGIRILGESGKWVALNTLTAVQFCTFRVCFVWKSTVFVCRSKNFGR